jgi:hypothetical protein
LTGQSFIRLTVSEAPVPVSSARISRLFRRRFVVSLSLRFVVWLLGSSLCGGRTHTNTTNLCGCDYILVARGKGPSFGHLSRWAGSGSFGHLSRWAVREKFVFAVSPGLVALDTLVGGLSD